MMNWLSSTLGLALREAWAIEQIFTVLGQIGKRGFAATLAIITELFSFLMTGTPITPYGDELDLTGYSIVFEDEFDGNEVDWNIWEARSVGQQKYFNASADQLSVKDGNLYLTAEYKDGEYGEGWYTGAMRLKERYTYGYYEVRAICNDDSAFNAAFWLQSEHSYDPEYSLGGPGGAEIDILENLNHQYGYSASKNTIHVAGIDGADDEGIDSYHMPSFYTQNDMYSEYNTYGVLWTEDEYIFYLNGVETVRTSFGNGVCEEPVEVILSHWGPGHDNSWQLNDYNSLDKNYKSVFTVDYVRIYQLTPTAE
ncbi:MAG: family 16 glycosylhydrolase [Clostridia bacterium]|nr:family 16 glycosylhydrolase [Clostridia bacterium]